MAQVTTAFTAAMKNHASVMELVRQQGNLADGRMNQGVKTTDSPNFAGAKVGLANSISIYYNSTASQSLPLQSSAAGSSAGAALVRFTTNGSYPAEISIGAANSDTEYTYTAHDSGASIGALRFCAADGTKMVFSAGITSQTEATTTTDAPTAGMTFYTSDGAYPAPRGRWAASGNLGVGTISPNASAMLDITSSNRGFLPPRMTTTSRNAISSPASGLLIFNTTTGKHEGYNGSSWNQFW